jgi:8-oxo-dGTP pyrophosphatase MutT (NUDIX family)
VALARARLGRHVRRVVPPGPLIAAAVLVPIVDHAGEPYMLFAKRTDRVGHHKGQISFPGGVIDPGDASSVDAALREAEEEIA